MTGAPAGRVACPSRQFRTGPRGERTHAAHDVRSADDGNDGAPAAAAWTGEFTLGDFHSLIERAKRGDDDAIAALYDRYGGAVSSVIRARLSPLLRQHYDTLDLWQSVFVEVLRELPRFEDRGERAFRNWLAVKGRSKVDAKLRKHVGPARRRVAVRLETTAVEGLGDLGPDPAARVEREDSCRALERALAGLVEIDRSVVRLRTQGGLDFDEIAARVGIVSADAARKRYARALIALRDSTRG